MTVLLVGHGSRDARFAATLASVAAATAQALPEREVHLAHLGLTDPPIPDALATLSGDVDVVPVLLSDAFHTQVDLPKILRDCAHEQIRTRQHHPIGGLHLVPALRDRLHQAGFGPNTGIIMSAVGSSNQAADTVVRTVGARLSRVMNAPVEVLFASRVDATSTSRAIARLRARGARQFAICPYFLSAGLLTSRIENAVDDCVGDWPVVTAGPLADHPAVIDAICRPVRRGALSGDLRNPGSTDKDILAFS